MSKFTIGAVKNTGMVATKLGFVIAKDGAVRSYREKVFNFDDVKNNKEIVKSYLGTSVISNLIFGDLKEKDNNVYLEIDGTQKIFDAMQINDIILEVNQSKNRVKTAIQGRRGTVKQYVSDGDFLITATGHITATNISDQNIYPEEEVNKLIKICSIPDSVPVTCAYLQLFGINNIVIDEYRIPQEMGKYNEQYFEISMSSDIEIDLEDVT